MKQKSRSDEAMSNAVCVGAQWGDEGKGKIVDLLSASADIIARFQGGNNAGHTLVVEGVQTILHLVPSGILHEGKICVIGNGCVVDPEILLQEIDMIQARGINITPENLWVSDAAHLILPFHKRIDKAREQERGTGRIGTTGRGIGPTYEEKAARTGMRMNALFDPKRMQADLRDRVLAANSFLSSLGADGIDGRELETMLDRVLLHCEKLAPYIRDVGTNLLTAIESGSKVLFEGAQGAMLDLDHGTYPFVTSSNTTSAEAAVGTGVGPKHLGNVICIAKAYTTRVGEGPFPTELDEKESEALRQAGQEFGATTGRPRRCGWIDLVQLRHALRINGATHLAITKLDVLCGLDKIYACVKYTLDGKDLDTVPHSAEDLARVKPVYEEFAGFGQFPEVIHSMDDFPEKARDYLNMVSDALKTELLLVSTGPGRSEHVMFLDPFVG
jgi:adenylosuccinate synthase